MTYKSKEQPLCRCCGKAIAKATWRHWVHAKDPHTTFMGSHDVIGVLRSKADCEKHTNRRVTYLEYRLDTDKLFITTEFKHVAWFSTWDGESYIDRYFCKGACAQKYAYMCVGSAHNRCVSNAYQNAREKQYHKLNPTTDRRLTVAIDTPLPMPRSRHIDIVFDGPPDHNGPTFIEVEDDMGRSIKCGMWTKRPDGYYALRLTPEELDHWLRPVERRAQ